MESFSERMLQMLNDGVMTDVTFIIQGTEIKAHRTAVGSHGGPLRDLLESKDERIKIKDIAPHTFRTILEYIYTDNCTVDPSNVFEIMHAAIKFKLKNLELCCKNEIKTKVCETNVGAFTAEALNFDAEELFQICQEYFSNNTTNVINANEFLEISNEVLVTFCSSEKIDCSEMALFTACVDWAKNKCDWLNLPRTPENLRAVLGEVVGKIRFSCIPKKDFEKIIVPMKILSFEEVGDIIVGWHTEEKSGFSDVDRSGDVKVIVKGYMRRASVFFSFLKKTEYTEDSVLFVPLSTTISQLKDMKIFDGGITQHPSDKFTLEHEGNELFDDEVLASIYTPGEDLTLKVCSVTYLVKQHGDNVEFLLPLKPEHLDERTQIVKGHFHIRTGIETNGLDIRFHDQHPGATVTVHLT